MCQSRNINILIDDRYDIVYDDRLFGILFVRPWSSNRPYKYKFTNWYDLSFRYLFSKKISNTVYLNGDEHRDINILIGLSGKLGSGIYFLSG